MIGKSKMITKVIQIVILITLVGITYGKFILAISLYRNLGSIIETYYFLPNNILSSVENLSSLLFVDCLFNLFVITIITILVVKGVKNDRFETNRKI